MFETAPYALSSFIADGAFNGVSFIDYVIYPSFQTQYNSCNFAFRTSFVDKWVTLDRVYKVEIIHVGHDYDMQGDVIEVGDVHGDKVAWRDPLQADDDYFLKH